MRTYYDDVNSTTNDQEQYNQPNETTLANESNEPQEQKQEHISPYTNEKNIKDDTDDRKILILPSGLYKKVDLLKDEIDMMSEDDIMKYLDVDDKVALDVAIKGLAATAPKGAFDGVVDGDTWSQNLKVGDKDVGLKELKIKTENLKGVLSGKKALAKFNVFLGLSNEIQIPLYHSGFHITLSNLSESDILDLTGRLARQKLEFGKNTNGLVFSNDNVLYTQIILDFVIEHMYSTTLKINDDDDIRNYIKTPDINMLALGIMRSIEPKGFKISRTCINALETDEHVKPKCNFTLTANLDLEKITFVDKDNMDDYHRTLLTRKSPSSVTVNEVFKYQETLSVLQPKDVVINIDDDTSIIVTLKVPDILNNIEAGEIWIDDIERSVETQLANVEDLTDQQKASMLIKMSKATLLNRYLHYVESITLGDSKVVDRPTIYELLNRMVARDDTYRAIANAFMDFIEKNVIYIIGIPQYTCPKCNESIDILDGNFKEIIPLNVYHTFLESCTLKVYELEKRTETT